jgi:hypothetical protein
VRNVDHHSAIATAIRNLAAEKSSACLLDAQGTFLFVNEAWDRHALANGGAPSCLGASLIGTRWLEHVRGGEVREGLADLLSRVLREPGPRPRALLQMGECNTPTTAALLSTRLEPVLHDGEAVAVRILHTVVRERPIAEVYDVVHRPLDSYRAEDGQVAQCSCCRRVRDPAEPERWDLVPALLSEPPAEASQVLCGYCAELHASKPAA